MADVARLGIAIESIGMAEVNSMLAGIEKKVANMAPAVPVIYATFRKIEQARFDGEGPGWKSLAAITVADRQYQGLGATPILSRAGANMRYADYSGRTGGQLRRSLTTLHAKNAVLEIGPDFIFMGTKDPVAQYHQFGMGSNPVRKVIDPAEHDALLYAQIINKYLFGFFSAGPGRLP